MTIFVRRVVDQQDGHRADFVGSYDCINRQYLFRLVDEHDADLVEPVALSDVAFRGSQEIGAEATRIAGQMVGQYLHNLSTRTDYLSEAI